MATDTEIQQDIDELTDDASLTDEERNWKALRTKADKANQDAAALAEENRKLKVQLAGIAEDHPLFKAALKAEDDAELKAIADVAKGAPAPAAEQEPTVDDPDISDDERNFTDLRRDAASGAAPDSQSQPDDVYAVTRTEFEADVDRGLTRDEAMARAFSKINHHAMAQDPRYHQQVNVANHDPIEEYGALPKLQ